MRALLEHSAMPGKQVRESMEAEMMSPRPPADGGKRRGGDRPSLSVMTGMEKKPPPGIAPGRSRLLHEMQAILKRELAAAGKDNDVGPAVDSLATEDGGKADPKVLSAYRQVWQKYIDETTMYNTILSAVKSEYEKHLQASDMNAEKVVVMENEHVRLVESHRTEKERLKREFSVQKKESEKVIFDLRGQVLMEQQKLTDYIASMESLRQAAAKDREQYEEMKKSCVTLTMAMTRMEDESREMQAAIVEKTQDCNSALTAQKKSYEEVEHIRHELQEMERKNAGMVSPENFEEHMRIAKEQREELHALQGTHKELIQRYTNLKGVIDTAFDKSISSSSSSSSLSAPQSPGRVNIQRTDVDREDPAAMVKTLVKEGTSPRVIIEALLDEIEELRTELKGAGGGLAVDGNDVRHDDAGVDDINSPWSHFDGLGLGKSVPEYLRTTGKIQNLNFSKRECEAYINDVWIAKANREKAVALQKAKEEKKLGSSILPNGEEEYDELCDLDKFFMHYIKKNFTKGKGLEFAYNLIDAVKKYSFDSDCRLFHLILTKQVSEEIHGDQIQLLNHIQEEMRREELRTRSSAKGNLPVDVFLRVIRKVNPTKGDQSFLRLKKALLIETNGSQVVNYIQTLEEDEDGNQGVFCEMLRSQHLMECVNFTEHMTNTIRETCHQDGKITTIARLREAICIADANKARSDVNALLCRGVGANAAIEEVLLMEAEQVPIKVERFLEKLRRGLLKKSAPRRG